MKRFVFIVVCLVCAVGFAGPSNAAVNLSLADLIGTADPGTPADATDELNRLNIAINFYNSSSLGGPANNPTPPPTVTYTFVIADGDPWGSNLSRPLDPATGGFQVDSGMIGYDVTGFTYLLAKFGNEDAYYFLGGQTGELEGIVSPFPVGDAKGGGLSHITLFGPGTTQVPEAGALLMFGSGLIGLVGYRRMRRMQ